MMLVLQFQVFQNTTDVLNQKQLATEALELLKISFDFNKATLRPESTGKLDQAAEIIKDAKDGNS
jgi:outer membrane protein OmpA-like peptidoglycan-associated protein